MSNTDNNKQDDTDVIRAEDIVPPYAANPNQHIQTGTTGPGSVAQDANEIPKFDLAEQIMAKQRKITAIRRKAPGQKTKAPDLRPRIRSTGYAIKQPPPALPENERIIAEIVARDIEKLYRGDSSSLRNW